jgi:hypothetical protein
MRTCVVVSALCVFMLCPSLRVPFNRKRQRTNYNTCAHPRDLHMSEQQQQIAAVSSVDIF